MNSLLIQWAGSNHTGHIALTENYWSYLDLVELEYTRHCFHLAACYWLLAGRFI